jgi:hypothetical protein
VVQVASLNQHEHQRNLKKKRPDYPGRLWKRVEIIFPIPAPDRELAPALADQYQDSSTSLRGA